MRELREAVALGVHPAEMRESGGTVDRVPLYVTRDCEPQLHAALGQQGFVLLIGESTAGKTRAAFEAMRLLLPDYSFVAPATRESVEVLLERPQDLHDDCVVWLDDLERFLGPGGLTNSALHRLLATHRRTVVLATMRNHEYDRYRDRNESELGGVEREVWREGRDVLRQAQVVLVERRWSTQERARAESLVADPRLTRALAADSRYGIAELLASGPELAECWRNAWTPGHHPRGAALVAAAVDARRAGYHRPLDAEALQRLHADYLERRGGYELRPESMQEAWAWALAPTFPGGANSLLIRRGEGVYLAFDYLIDLPEHEAVPNEVWRAVLDLAPAADLCTISYHAFQTCNYEAALPALRRAAEAGIGAAEVMLWDWGMPLRPAQEGLAAAQDRLQTLRSRNDTSEIDILRAEHAVAVFTHHCGHRSEAYLLEADILRRATDSLGEEHRLILAVRFCLALYSYSQDRPSEGLALLSAVVHESARALGVTDHAVLERRCILAKLFYEAGRVHEANMEATRLVRDSVGLPDGHPTRLSIHQFTSRISQTA
ncbi:hypothetical protein [Streptomyces sp. NPDC005573]|uniref:hypothetical protein n=1 Tax=Streptomyces sp. NPDC005573 TaxID=3156890 RepID=UPI0033AA3820